MNPQLIRILHVEDDPGDARLVEEMLKERVGDGASALDFDLVHAARLGEALTVLAADPIHLVLADLTLPDSDGLDTISQIHRAAPTLPLVVMSSANDESLAIQAAQEGAQDYLVKGRVDRYVLTRTLRHAIERKRAEQAHQQRAEQLGLLYDAGLALNRILDPHAQVEFLLKISRQSLYADRAAFFQWNEMTGQIGFQCSVGFPRGTLSQLRDYSPRSEAELEQRVSAQDENNVVAWVARHRVPLNLPDLSLDPRHNAFDPEVRSGLGVPVQHEEKLLGVIMMLSTRPSAFSPEDGQLLMLFANQLAVALENARLFSVEKTRRKELSALYDLSRALADTTDIQAILDLTARHTTETISATFARIALIEHDELVVRAACPIRVLDQDLQIGRRVPLAALPRGACRRALEQGTLTIVQADSQEMDAVEREFLFVGVARALCLVPLRAGEQALGLLMVGEARREDREPFTSEKMRLASSIGDQLASGLYRWLLRAQTNHRLEQLQALRKVDQAIMASLDLRVTFDIFLEQVVSQLHVDAADVLLLNPRVQMLEFAAECGFRSRKVKRRHMRLGEGHAGRAALERRVISVPDHHDQDLDAQLKDEQFVAHCSIPLIAKGEVKGVLDVYRRSPIDASPEWLDFLEQLAGQAAIAIDNATLFDNLQRANVELANAYDATIEGWSRALDLRDKETEGHTQRVTEITLQLARVMGFSDSDLVHIRRGALLHDIGKVGIPDSVLFKPGALTDVEWEIMRKHPQFAYDLLSPIAYLQSALDIPYCHHEKWDGTGYPRGLKGEQIPLVARIFAVVDVWDALRSKRPYREAWSEEKIRGHILSQARIHFDPRVVEVFLSQIQDWQGGAERLDS